MPKGFNSKCKKNPNESSTIVACPLCEWRGSKGSKTFLKKMMLCHLKMNHNIIMTIDELDKNSDNINYRYKKWETHKLHNHADKYMKSIKN